MDRFDVWKIQTAYDRHNTPRAHPRTVLIKVIKLLLKDSWLFMWRVWSSCWSL